MAEVKGDLVALYFYGRLLNQLRVLQGTRRPDMKFIYATGAEELYPLLEQICSPVPRRSVCGLYPVADRAAAEKCRTFPPERFRRC